MEGTQLLSQALLVSQTIAILATGLFAGVALFLTLLQRPLADRKSPTNMAVSVWRAVSGPAKVMQVSSALVGSISAAMAAASGGGRAWLLAGGIIASVIPYTVIAILPTVQKLQDEKLEAESSKAKMLLAKWYGLHAFRTVVSIVAFTLMVALK